MSTQGMHSSLSNRFGFNRTKEYTPFTVPVLSGTYYNNYSNIPNNTTQSAGTARIVMNGYGILLYGWQHTSTGTSMHNVQIPELIGCELDITVIGSGGYSGGGGSGGGAGAGGGRHQVKCTDQAFYLSTGSHMIGTSWNDAPGNNELKNTRLYMDGGNVDIKAQHAGGPNTVSTTSGCNVYTWKGARRSTQNQSNQQNVTSALQQVDTQLEYAYGGVGGCLPSFGGANCQSQKDGGDIGGGGGATDCQNYGGSCNGGSGGRYGFNGGEGNTTAQSLNGYGPVGGRFYSGDTYRRGGGGAFGGGIGDGGNGNTTIMGGGGAIFIRWDTYDLGNFQAKENWPPDARAT